MNSAATRRDILLAIAGAIAGVGIAGFPPAIFAQSEVTVSQFLALSRKLTQASGLDEDIAKTLLGGFLATGNGPALAQLVTGADEYGPLADAIVAAWYSGLYDTANGQAVATFDQALVWTALSFTKPFGSCGGETGYWADPPQN
jgi:hypothetical protein